MFGIRFDRNGKGLTETTRQLILSLPIDRGNPDTVTVHAAYYEPEQTIPTYWYETAYVGANIEYRIVTFRTLSYKTFCISSVYYGLENLIHEADVEQVTQLINSDMSTVVDGRLAYMNHNVYGLVSDIPSTHYTAGMWFKKAPSDIEDILSSREYHNYGLYLAEDNGTEYTVGCIGYKAPDGIDVYMAYATDAKRGIFTVSIIKELTLREFARLKRHPGQLSKLVDESNKLDNDDEAVGIPPAVVRWTLDDDRILQEYVEEIRQYMSNIEDVLQKIELMGKYK